MKKIFIVFILILINVYSQELQIKANYFESDTQKGVSVFKGNVYIKKGFDELNASKVIILTNKKKEPVKYTAIGNVLFKIEDENKNRYKGKAQKVIYIPQKKVYEFYTDVVLKQIGKNKVIKGNEVIFNSVDGKALAKGANNKPVIMIFDIKEEKK